MTREARKMADGLKKEINKHYKCMEIDLDGMMVDAPTQEEEVRHTASTAAPLPQPTLTTLAFLLLHTHRYAALMVEEKNGELITTRETKGLDLVRRDWCTLSREAGLMVLDFILAGLNRRS